MKQDVVCIFPISLDKKDEDGVKEVCGVTFVFFSFALFVGMM